MQFRYPATLITYSDDEVVVQFYDFPEILASGTNKNEALTNAIDALDEAIAGRMNRNEDIPEPSVKLRAKYVIVSLQIALKAVIYIHLRKYGINKSQFAKKIGSDEKVARRILDPKYNTPLKKLEDALSILSIEVVIGANESEVEGAGGPEGHHDEGRYEGHHHEGPREEFRDERRFR